MTERTSTILNKAADLIETRGWVQADGWAYSPADDNSLCLEGGIMAAVGFTGGQDRRIFKACPAYRAVWDYLTDDHWKGAPFRTDLYDWNDAQARTKDEVIEVLRAAALIESAREEQNAAYATYSENLALVAS